MKDLKKLRKAPDHVHESRMFNTVKISILHKVIYIYNKTQSKS